MIRYVDVPTLDPDRVRDLDPTGTHAEVMEIFTTLVRDIDDRTKSASPCALDVDLVEAEFEVSPWGTPRGSH